jgi:GNAT superfamily N-acetyltransferase
MSDDAVRIDLDREPTPDDMLAVRTGLRAYNASQVGPGDYSEFAVYVRDGDGTILGGILAEAGRGWLHVSILWVDERLRGQGYGARLLSAAEEEGHRLGCHGVYLDTFSFQARPFYEHLGYEVYGTLDDYPAGHQRYFLRKSLEPSEPPA